MKRDRSLLFANPGTRRILEMVRLGLGDAIVAKACRVTPAHVAELREAYGEPGPWIVEVALPRGLGAAIDAEAERRGVTPPDVVADIVKQWTQEQGR